MKTQADTLTESIALLQIKQTQELRVLKGHFHLMYESLKPINFIKSTLQEVVSTPEITTDLLDNVIGLATGYVSKKILIGTTHNPIKQLVGTLIQFAIANIVARHSDTIKLIGGNIIQRIFGKK